MPSQLTYQDFDLLIEPGSPGSYRARVLRSPAGESAPVEFSLPFSTEQLEIFVLKVGRPRRGGTRGPGRPEGTPLKAFGGQLYDAVFQDELRDTLLRSLSETGTQGTGLRLRLRLADTPELASLPWEFLYDPRRNRFLALSHRTPLVRYLDLPDPPRPLGVQGPLRLLVMISSPSDYPTLDVEQEWITLSDALAPLQAAGRVAVERLAAASLSALQQRLRREGFHVFHFIGHGGYRADWGNGVLVMQDRSGRGREVAGEELGGLLNDHDPMRLAVLNACEGARSDATDPFAGVAQSLVQQGLPAVVAMQFEITDQAAIIFAHELYGAVADGYPLDAALAEARRAIRNDGNPTEWGTPVLYSRAPDGRLFDLTARPPTVPAGSAATPTSSGPVPGSTAPGEAAAAERARARAEEASERARKLAEERATRVRVVGDRVDRAEALFRRREYVQALSVCAEILQEFGNSADPALLAYIQRARELSQQAKKQLFRRRWRRWSLMAIAPAVAIGIFLGWRLDGTTTVPGGLEDVAADFGPVYDTPHHFTLNTLEKGFDKDTVTRLRSTLESKGFQRGFRRTAGSTSDKLRGVLIMQFESPAAAKEALPKIGTCWESPDKFNIPSVPEAMGQRCKDMDGTPVQEVSFTRGRLLFKVKLQFFKKKPQSTAEIVEMAHAQAEKAR